MNNSCSKCVPVEILIVEDNPGDADLALRALSKNHIANHIEVVEDGEEALDFLFCRGKFEERTGQALPRVVFLDLKLPKVSGLEVLKVIRAEPGTARLPVVIVTSSKEDPDIKDAYSLGANSYVVKPIDIDDFFHAMVNLGIYWLALNEPPETNG